MVLFLASEVTIRRDGEKCERENPATSIDETFYVLYQLSYGSM
jgi:hypothetical protein